MNWRVLTLLVSLGSGAAQTVPLSTPAPPTVQSALLLNAQTVFDEGARLLKTFYFGFSTVNLDEQISFYRGQLDRACRPDLRTCPVSSGWFQEVFTKLCAPRL